MTGRVTIFYYDKNGINTASDCLNINHNLDKAEKTIEVPSDTVTIKIRFSTEYEHYVDENFGSENSITTDDEEEEWDEVEEEEEEEVEDKKVLKEELKQLEKIDKPTKNKKTKLTN